MIKLGIFGDQSVNLQLLKQVKKTPDTEVSGACFYGNAEVPAWIDEISSPAELMDRSDAILFMSDKNVSNDLIRLVLRKSRHVYLKTIPNLQHREVKELIDLEKEAGIVTFIYNPFDYLPFFESFHQRYEKPFLINIRTCFEDSGTKSSHELLLLVTALCRITQSSMKKLDILGIGEQTDQLTIDLRIEFVNGCVIHLTITSEKSPGSFEVFDTKGRSRFEFKSSLYALHPQFNHEFSAISSFIAQVSGQERKTGSFDNLLSGIQILHEIKQHLRFNEIIF